ncbi:MAG: Smr/MutS family protein [Saprospiraceae bacterium]|nr:Smr/MutS family protein [Saprospiraceae bacterium]
MKIAPNDLYQKLEFDKILELLKTFCLGEAGKASFQQPTIHTDAHRIERSLQETADFVKTYAHSHNFPIAAYFTVDEELRMLRIEGYVLSVEGFKNIARLLQMMQRIFSFFNRKDTKELYPSLHHIIRHVDFDRELLQEINRVVDPEGNIRPDASPALLKIARKQNSKRQELDKTFRQLIVTYQSQGKLTDNIESFRNGRRVLAVPIEFKRQIRGIIHDESASGKTVYIEPEGVIGINNDLFDLEQEYKREIYRILRDLSVLLSPYVPLIEQYQNIIIHYDTIRAKAELATRMKGQKPKLFTRPHFKLTKAYHPLLYLKNSNEGDKTVPFDLEFKHNNRILMLSGPNAGGKSICLKAVGLLQLMVQFGMLLPVEEGSEIGIFRQIFVDIGDQQSLEDELSTYSSRLKNAKWFVEHADKETLVLIDEFGSGTDPKMGGAIAEAILKELNYKSVYGVITTHYSNLKVFAYENKGLVNGSMIFDQETLSPTYEMKVGKPGSSYAFEIAQKSGLPNKIIKYAQQKVGKQVHNFDELLVDLQRERQKAKEAHAALLDQQKKLDHLIKNYEYAQRELEFGRKKLKLQIKEQELVDTRKSHKELQKMMRELREEENKQKAAEKVKALIQETHQERKQLDSKVGQIKEDLYKVYEQKSRKEGKIEEGSHVRLRAGGSTGIVRSIQKKDAIVEVGNLSLQIKLRDLELIPNALEIKKATTVNTERVSRQAHFESKVDIRGMRYEEAMEAIQNFMDEAMMANVPQVRIIHGKGTGILRKAVSKKLREYPNIKETQHPEPHRGGDGVTIIIFE